MDDRLSFLGEHPDDEVAAALIEREKQILARLLVRLQRQVSGVDPFGMAVRPDLVAREIVARNFDKDVDKGLLGGTLCLPPKLQHHSEFAKSHRDVIAGRVPPSDLKLRP